MTEPTTEPRSSPAFRARLTAARAMWAELWRRPVPDDLKDPVSEARQAQDTFFAEQKSLTDAMPAELPSRFTDAQYQAFQDRHEAWGLARVRTTAALSVITVVNPQRCSN